MFSVVIAYFINGEPIIFMEIGGMAISFVGIYIFADGKQSSGTQAENRVYAFGLVAILISACFTAVCASLTRKLKDIHYTILAMSNNLTTLIGASVVVAFTTGEERNGLKILPILATVAAATVFPIV